MPSQIFTYTTPNATQTFTVPAGITSIKVICIGGGGGGGICYQTGGGGGGGAGGYASSVLSTTPGTTYNLTVGWGGAANYFYQSESGGTTTFGVGASLVSATGGLGGLDSRYYGIGGGGTGTSGQILRNGGYGWYPTENYGYGSYSGAGGSVGNDFVDGANANGYISYSGYPPYSGQGGYGIYDGDPFGGELVQQGWSGSNYGGGGGGGYSNMPFGSVTGGQGAAGVVVVQYGTDVNSNFFAFF